MAEPLTGGAGSAVPDARRSGLFSKRWMKAHGVELAAGIMGLLVVLYLWSRSRSSSQLGFASPGGSVSTPSAPAAPSGGGSSGLTQPVDLSPILDALTQGQQVEAQGLDQLSQSQQAVAAQQAAADQSLWEQMAASFKDAFAGLAQGQQSELAALSGQQQSLLQAIANNQGGGLAMQTLQQQLAGIEAQIGQLQSGAQRNAPTITAPGGLRNPTPGLSLGTSQPSNQYGPVATVLPAPADFSGAVSGAVGSLSPLTGGTGSVLGVGEGSSTQGQGEGVSTVLPPPANWQSTQLGGSGVGSILPTRTRGF